VTLFELLDNLEAPALALVVVEGVVEGEVVTEMQHKKLKSQIRISTSNHPMPSSTSRTWSKRQLQDLHLARLRQ
jgi:glycerate-2-kinase